MDYYYENLYYANILINIAVFIYYIVSKCIKKPKTCNCINKNPSVESQNVISTMNLLKKSLPIIETEIKNNLPDLEKNINIYINRELDEI